MEQFESSAEERRDMREGKIKVSGRRDREGYVTYY